MICPSMFISKEGLTMTIDDLIKFYLLIYIRLSPFATQNFFLNIYNTFTDSFKPSVIVNEAKKKSNIKPSTMTK